MIADLKITQPRRRQGRLRVFVSFVLFALLSLVLFTSPVFAVRFVQVDLDGVPQVGGPAAFDTHGGLIWLKLSTLQTSDYDAAEGYMGFRHATEGEVLGLLNWFKATNDFNDPAGCNVSVPFIGDAPLLFPACVLFPDLEFFATSAVFNDGDPADGVGVGTFRQDTDDFCEEACSTTVHVMPNGVLPGLGLATRTDPAPHWMVKTMPTQCTNTVDDDADGLIDTVDPDCINAADNSEYHLSSGDILAVSYESPPALYRIDPVTGVLTYLMGHILEKPWGVAIGPTGEIYISDAGLHTIKELDPLDGSTRSASPHSTLDFPRSMVVEPDGNLLVADGGARTVFRIDPDARVATDLTYTGCIVESILEPRVLAFAPSPTSLAYVTDGWTGRVYEVSYPTSTTMVCAHRGSGTAITNPWGLVIEDDGQLLVADSTSKEIVRLNLSTYPNTETPLHTSSWNFNVPRGMTWEAAGTLLVADYLNEAIYRLDVDTGTQVALATGRRFTDVAVLPASNPSVQVPGLPSIGLALLACGLSAAAMRRLRGRGESARSGSEAGW